MWPIPDRLSDKADSQSNKGLISIDKISSDPTPHFLQETGEQGSSSRVEMEGAGWGARWGEVKTAGQD